MFWGRVFRFLAFWLVFWWCVCGGGGCWFCGFFFLWLILGFGVVFLGGFGLRGWVVGVGRVCG